MRDRRRGGLLLFDLISMRNRWWMLILVLSVVLGSAEAAWAWGPATHVALAESVLKQLGLLPAAVGALLARHGLAYLYGSIAADVVFAKRWSRVKQFCHHWSTGFKLLEVADCDKQKAFAYGYLSHLAADTVAHGKYVPLQVVVSDCSVNLGHLYWELRADAARPVNTWQRLEWVLAHDHGSHHRLLQQHIKQTFLPYEVNRMLFDGMNALTLRPGFRRTIRVAGSLSRWPLSDSLLEGYTGESIDRILSVLSQERRSPVLRDDPNGTSALMKVHVHRRAVRRLRRIGAPVEHRVREASLGLAPQWNTAAIAVQPAGLYRATGPASTSAPVVHV
jgi:hypothetical protein